MSKNKECILCYDCNEKISADYDEVYECEMCGHKFCFDCINDIGNRLCDECIEGIE